MTPGTAAAPAPGCWLRCLRSMRSGTAAARLLLPEAAKGYEIGKGRTHAPGPNSAYNVASVMRNCCAIAVQRLLHSHNPRYTHSRAGWASSQSTGKSYELQRQSCCSGPQRSGPQLLHAAAAARAGLRAVVGGISARSCCTQRSSPGRAR